MTRWSGLGLRLGLGLLLATAVGNAAWAQRLADFDGQYVGELQLAGVIRGDCTTPPLGAVYPLTVSRGQVSFAYLPLFATTLRGTIGPNGVFKASARVRHGVVEMTGRIRGLSVTADLVSPSCRYTFHTQG